MNREGQRRLFIALWPDDTVRAALAERAAPIQAAAGGKRVPVAHYHVTLAFLGWQDEARYAALLDCAAGVKGAAFDLAIDRAGWWRKGGILWLGPTRTPEALKTLAADLQNRLIQAGVEVDRRPFKAHLTIGRRTQRADDFLGSREPVPWPVKEFVLVQSHTDGRRPAYEVLARWPLA